MRGEESNFGIAQFLIPSVSPSWVKGLNRVKGMKGMKGMQGMKGMRGMKGMKGMKGIKGQSCFTDSCGAAMAVHDDKGGSIRLVAHLEVSVNQ